MVLLKTTKRFFNTENFRPSRRKGQIFLVSDIVLDRIIEILAPEQDDLVVDVGAGPGIIAESITKYCRCVVAIENDPSVYRFLQIRSEQFPAIIPLKQDARYFDYSLESLQKSGELKQVTGNVKLLGNIPYYATYPILSAIQQTGRKLNTMVFLIQKEVAERLLAKPGTKAMSVMTLKTQFFWNVTPDMIVPETAFRPVPKVKSQLILAKPNIPLPLQESSIEPFFKFISPLFLQKRKKIKNLFRATGYNPNQIEKFQNILENNNHSLDDRPERFSLSIWLDLFKALTQPDNLKNPGF